jgi:site-specific recombinase XerD
MTASPALVSPSPFPTLHDSAPGSNQGSRTLTRATTDAEAVSSWLARYVDTPHTFASYRREAERLLMWLASRNLRLADMMVEDAVAYDRFLRDPLPRERWCLIQEPRKLDDGTPNPAWKSVQRAARTLHGGATNPAWRPFLSGLGESAAKLAGTVLFGMLEYLASISWIATNVMRASRRRSSAPVAEIERYLERDRWQGLLEHIEMMPREVVRQEAHYQRVRFAVRFLYLTGLRREEFCSLVGADLVVKRGRHWLTVLGKGNKLATIPLNASAVHTIQEYRVSLGLLAWPEYGDASPLLRDVTGKRAISVKALHQLLTAAFSSSPDPVVRQASAHWLRHTCCSHMLESGMALTEVRDVMRHGNISTTSRYAHAERDKLHQSSEKHCV